MTPTMEELGGCVAEWSVILFGQGMEVNSAKPIVMVGSSASVGYSCVCR